MIFSLLAIIVDLRLMKSCILQDRGGSLIEVKIEIVGATFDAVVS